jgi:hypothetical protein
MSVRVRCNGVFALLAMVNSVVSCFARKEKLGAVTISDTRYLRCIEMAEQKDNQMVADLLATIS